MEKVLDYTGAKGTLTFLDTNLSEQLRTNKRTKDSLMFLNLVLNDKGRWIIQRERGNEIVVKVEDLNLKQAPQTVATFEEAIGY